VVRYRNLWTPYVRAVVEATRDYKGADPTSKKLAELIAKSWNAYAGTTPAELLLISDSALKTFQETAKDSLVLGANPWMVNYPIPDVPTESEQSLVINALENANLIGRGVLEILGRVFSVDSLQAGAGVVGETAGTVTGSLLGGLSKGVSTGTSAMVKSSGIPTWVWVAAAGLGLAMLPTIISGNPLYQLGRITKRFI
jgi:hypothetical protein